MVLYNHSAQDVSSLFEDLANDATLSGWVVVDNGGSDEACAVAESLCGRCLHPGRNLGYGACRNLALWSLVEAALHRSCEIHQDSADARILFAILAIARYCVLRSIISGYEALSVDFWVRCPLPVGLEGYTRRP